MHWYLSPVPSWHEIGRHWRTQGRDHCGFHGRAHPADTVMLNIRVSESSYLSQVCEGGLEEHRRVEANNGVIENL
ncbi:hypothetical protein LCGC14_1167620 [marine sediment metagenome]|uniref:Uncharacterized protein n=1 Tax=marine sediment metagenome TaxID=412755 RepID=A0A0F9PW82_9ZZZZ